ncbi:MAG: alternative ribosome rescue aminoacyl-tRNA hydrolase ArfB [bacterium]
MIQVTETIAIREDELQFDFIRATGPGGQNVNKVATAVQLRFDVRNSPSLPDFVRERLIRLAGKKITSSGVLIITARRYRSQEKNRQDAVERLLAMIQKAAVVPKLRKKTKPSAQSKRLRLQAKRHRGKIKEMRRIDPLSEK